MKKETEMQNMIEKYNHILKYIHLDRDIILSKCKGFYSYYEETMLYYNKESNLWFTEKAILEPLELHKNLSKNSVLSFLVGQYFILNYYPYFNPNSEVELLCENLSYKEDWWVIENSKLGSDKLQIISNENYGNLSFNYFFDFLVKHYKLEFTNKKINAFEIGNFILICEKQFENYILTLKTK